MSRGQRSRRGVTIEPCQDQRRQLIDVVDRAYIVRGGNQKRPQSLFERLLDMTKVNPAADVLPAASRLTTLQSIILWTLWTSMRRPSSLPHREVQSQLQWLDERRRVSSGVIWNCHHSGYATRKVTVNTEIEQARSTE